jgi:hypothetical protein
MLASIRYTFGQIEAHPHQPIDEHSNIVWIGFWSFVIGLPILALILGIEGILPGTRRKRGNDHVA